MTVFTEAAGPHPPDSPPCSLSGLWLGTGSKVVLRVSLARVPVARCHAGADHVLPDARPLWFREHCHVWCLGPAVLQWKTKAVSLEKREKSQGA